MKIFDMHIHARNKKPDPACLIAQMDKAGIYGGCIFSTRPVENDSDTGITFEERLNEVLGWTTGYEDRLYPVLWIHPYEDDIIKKIHIAVEKGISAFKIICNDFYVYEEQCLKVLNEIALLKKPVFFHSGILWDGKVSSVYNRPLNWEALLRIKGLRFSMGHCSWPWIDECIALYGKFLNSLLKGDTAEMFFDITPGTPQIYREELLTKLYTVGYDMSNNIMFGTDSYADGYSVDWTKSWIETDREIMDNIGISKENREKLYFRNLMRFLGKTNEAVIHTSPETDDAHQWTPVNQNVEKVIKKWYDTLEFSDEFDAEFKKALSDIKIADTIEAESYKANEDGKRNLLSCLYMCENLKYKYAEKNIPENILIDTLKDIVIWTYIWSDLKNELYLGEFNWLKHHLSMKLFKLGRLQFCMGKAECDIPDFNVEKGDDVLEIHIPQTGPLYLEECRESIEMAKEFFDKYYPEFQYKCFICHSWLLDKTLAEILDPESNIIKFQNMFVCVREEESYSILRYIFKWNTTKRTVIKEIPMSSLAKKVKDRILEGGKFYETLGVIEK